MAEQKNPHQTPETTGENLSQVLKIRRDKIK